MSNGNEKEHFGVSSNLAQWLTSGATLLFMVGILIMICGIIFMKNITDRENADLNMLYVSLSSFGFAAPL